MSNAEPASERLALGYYPFSEYLRRRYGCKVQKVSLHAGFTCPNRDGRAGVGGCTYCVNESFSPQARSAAGGETGKPAPAGKPVREQMADGIAHMRARYGAKKFFAYFQAFSNTYAPVERLRALYDEAVSFPDVVGLSIGTRPDCVPPEVLDLVAGYAAKPAAPSTMLRAALSDVEAAASPDGKPDTSRDRGLEVWLEYGVQSAHDETLRRINRGHDFAAFCDAVERTKGRNIRICAHVILGLPGETREDMMQTALALQPLGLDGIKLHHLYLARGAPLEADYLAGRVRLFSAREYVQVACDFLERIPDTVAVQRLVGDTTSHGILMAPCWLETKAEVLRLVAEEFHRRGTRQGARTPALVSSAIGAV